MKKFLSVLFLSCLIFSSFAQDTLKVMHYNLLNYANTTSYCTQTNNNVTDKANYLKTIVDYTLPDVLTVNELGSSSFAAQHLLDNSLNVNGRNYFQKAINTNLSGDNLVNMLYYDSRKLGISWEHAIQTNVRDINLYKLFYKSSTLSIDNDTAFLMVIVAHLKAGSSSSDKNTRAAMTSSLMQYLDNISSPMDIIFAGDFNVYTSSEQAFQNLVSHSNLNIRFADPINTLGSWNNNSTYKAVHTQSTHYSSNGCASGGGMDDRFDFILANNSVIYGLIDYKYVPGTYKALGNDGNHFNSSINYGSNNSVPPNVIDALYNMSDHLPVVMELEVNQTGAGLTDICPVQSCKIVNPVIDQIMLYFKHPLKHNSNLEVYSMAGQLVYSENLEKGMINKSLPVNFEKGLYILLIKNENSSVRKVMIKI